MKGGAFVKLYKDLLYEPPFLGNEEFFGFYACLLARAEFPSFKVSFKREEEAKKHGKSKATIDRWLRDMVVRHLLRLERGTASTVITMMDIEEEADSKIAREAATIQPRGSGEAATPSPASGISPSEPPQNRYAKNKNKQEKMMTSSLCPSGVPYEELLLAWNCNKELPRCIKLTEERKKKMALRWKEQPDINTWISACQRLAMSDFATGKTGGSWRASFEWLFRSAENVIKVLEGKYDNRGVVKTKTHNTKVAMELIEEEGL